MSKSFSINESAADNELISNYGNDFGRPTEYLFDEKGMPKAPLKKIKTDLLRLKSMLKEQPSSELLQLNDRFLHGEKTNGKVSWENEHFYQIPTSIVFANLNLLLMDLNTIRFSQIQKVISIS
jgi:hypothetical protein